MGAEPVYCALDLRVSGGSRVFNTSVSFGCETGRKTYVSGLSKGPGSSMPV